MQYEKMCRSVVIFVLIFAFLMITVFEVKAVELDGGGKISVGYLKEYDTVIMNYDVILYVSQKEKFGGSVFAGMDFPCKQITIASKFPYLVQFTIGGSLNYDILYILAQGYSAIDYFRNVDYQVKLAVGINYNMPYQIFNSLQHNPFFSPGIDLSLGYLPGLNSYFANIDVALYVRPDKLINGVIFGGVEVLSESSGKYGGSAFLFRPYQDRYSFGYALNITMFSLRIEHYCIHPVWSDPSQFEAKAYAESSTKYSIGIQYHYPFKVKRI
ncbi:hypothetical protein ES705_17150 [subsurface metagenome]